MVDTLHSVAVGLDETDAEASQAEVNPHHLEQPDHIRLPDGLEQRKLRDNAGGRGQLQTFVINGQAITVTGAANQSVSLPNGDATINEQVLSATATSADLKRRRGGAGASVNSAPLQPAELRNESAPLGSAWRGACPDTSSVGAPARRPAAGLHMLGLPRLAGRGGWPNTPNTASLQGSRFWRRLGLLCGGARGQDWIACGSRSRRSRR